MAELLSSQYSSVYSQPSSPMLYPQDIFVNADTEGLENFVFAPDDFVVAIDELKPTAAAGPDGFPAKLLKECKKTLKVPLFLIWRKSMDKGIVPSLLKTANVIPIHKGKSKGVPANYRPVALTSHIIKVFEKILRNHIVQYMEDHSLFNPTQHGFRKGRSCLSQLITHYENIISNLEAGKNVDVIYLDFAKAFDKVDFLIILKKLNSMGIKGKIGTWIHSFLTNRTQRVLVNGESSKPSAVISGVPQGSVLGPLLFLVLIGDIDKNVSSAFISSFADDTRATHDIENDADR